MEQSQQGDGSQVSQVGIHHPAAVAKRFPPGVSGNPGGIDKATGLPGRTLRARLREKLEADEARLERILEARIALCEPSKEVEPHVTLKAMDDLIDHIDGKLDKGVVNKGEPSVVVIHGPRPESP